MKRKDYIQTIRLTKPEWEDVSRFIKLNPTFESFSSVARTAIRQFLRHKSKLETITISSESAHRPYFLWDYNFSEEEVHELLSQQSFEKKKWLIARILEQARFEDVWKYLSVDDIQVALPLIRMSPKKKEYWNHAIKVWNKK